MRHIQLNPISFFMRKPLLCLGGICFSLCVVSIVAFSVAMQKYLILKTNNTEIQKQYIENLMRSKELMESKKQLAQLTQQYIRYENGYTANLLQNDNFGFIQRAASSFQIVTKSIDEREIKDNIIKIQAHFKGQQKKFWYFIYRFLIKYQFMNLDSIDVKNNDYNVKFLIYREP